MSWKRGQSGNPKGRPRSGNSLTEAIRRTVDPDEVIRKLVKIMDESPSDQTRLRAAEILLERGWKKPAQVLEVGPADPYEDLSEDELLQLEAESVAELTETEALLLSGDVSVQDVVEPSAVVEHVSVGVEHVDRDHVSEIVEHTHAKAARAPSSGGTQADTCSTTAYSGVKVRKRKDNGESNT